jgi:hypothetical protein
MDDHVAGAKPWKNKIYRENRTVSCGIAARSGLVAAIREQRE